MGGGLLMGLIEGQGIACEPPAAPTIVQAARAVGGLVALAVGTGLIVVSRRRSTQTD